MDKLNQTYFQIASGIKGDWLNGKSYHLWYDYITGSSDEVAKDVYLVVILEKQVVNGGFHQYFSNRYGQFSYDTLESLERIGAELMENLLVKAIEVVNIGKLSKEVSAQKQARHIKGTAGSGKGYLDSLEDAQEVLDAVNSGKAEFLGHFHKVIRCMDTVE